MLIGAPFVAGLEVTVEIETGVEVLLVVEPQVPSVVGLVE
jgi:hypothetical protein